MSSSNSPPDRRIDLEEPWFCNYCNEKNPLIHHVLMCAWRRRLMERKFKIAIEELQDGGYIARASEEPTAQGDQPERQLVGSTKSQVRAKINKWLKEVL